MKLKQLRLEKGLQLRIVAEDLKMALSTISKYETGSSPIPDKMKKIFADYYGVNVEDIEFEDNEYKTLKDTIKDLTNQLEAKDNEIKQIKKECKEELSRKNKELGEYKDYVSNLESQINNFNARMRRMQALMKSSKYRKYIHSQGGDDF